MAQDSFAHRKNMLIHSIWNMQADKMLSCQRGFRNMQMMIALLTIKRKNWFALQLEIEISLRHHGDEGKEPALKY